MGREISRALKTLGIAAETDSRIARLSVPTSGRQIIIREKLGGPLVHRGVFDFVDALTRGHEETKKIFIEVEECFEKVLASSSSAAANQARIRFDELEILWYHQKPKLQGFLEDQARKGGRANAKQSAKQAKELAEKLDDFFYYRAKFVTWVSEIPLELRPSEFKQRLRKKLSSKAKPQTAILGELSPGIKEMPLAPAVTSAGPKAESAELGRELLKDLRQLSPSNMKPNKMQIQPSSKPPSSSVPSIDAQIQGLTKLELHCPEGDVFYDDMVKFIDTYPGARQAKGEISRVGDQKFINELTDKVKGKMGERLVFEQTEFISKVWKPSERTALNLCEQLNKAPEMVKLPEAKRWHVVPSTEPMFATVITPSKYKFGKYEFLDSGIWVIRESDDGNFAIPVFFLEVKSGELRTAMSQQVSDWFRLNGGVLTVPSTGKRYRMTFPPRIVLERALATTRTLTDKTLLGKTKGLGPKAERRLSAGENLHTFRIPMRRSDIRAAAYAIVLTRLKQLKKKNQ
jgi:hypothetical protein